VTRERANTRRRDQWSGKNQHVLLSRSGHSGHMQRQIVTTLFLVLLNICDATTTCHATCSRFVTLPCNFGRLDKCLQRDCETFCREDGGRKLIGCYCRGGPDRQTNRMCFCGPSKNGGAPKNTLL
ncbi:hypothetical protein PENTCL1PPCAC_11302, partial [Pristionchus entomophagus]